MCRPTGAQKGGFLSTLGSKPGRTVKLSEEEECEEGQRSDKTRPNRTRPGRTSSHAGRVILFSLSLYLGSAGPSLSVPGSWRGAGVTHIKQPRSCPLCAGSGKEMSNICGRRRTAEFIPRAQTREEKKIPKWLEFKQIPLVQNLQKQPDCYVILSTLMPDLCSFCVMEHPMEIGLEFKCYS